MILKIAFKNVWRNKVRSLVVMVSVILGLSGGIFSAAVLTGMVEQKIRTGINNEVSHLQMHHPGYLKNSEAQFTISSPDSILQNIASKEEVKAVCARTRLTGMAASAHFATGIQLMGIDPQRERLVTSIYAAIPDGSGSYFGGDRKNQLLLGQKLADKLKVRVKSKVVIRFQSRQGELIEAAFVVIGIFQTSNAIFDESTVFVKKSDLDLMTAGDNGIHEMAILLRDIETLKVSQTTLSQCFPQLKVRNWMEIRPEMGMITAAISVEVYVILGIILFALAFGIVNTMLMIVFERTRELGMLMAVGMSKSRIFRMIMLETLFLTVIGGIIGMVASSLLVAWFQQKGIDLSAFAKGLESYGVDPKIYPFISRSFYFHLSIMILSTGILSAVMPARKALKLDPVEAIRVD